MTKIKQTYKKTTKMKKRKSKQKKRCKSCGRFM